MTTHRCPGLVSTNLMTYLAGLGLARVIAEQADSDARFGWRGRDFVISTTVPDLAAFLIEQYSPTPIVSPWNGRGGFSEKDKKPPESIERLLNSDTQRLASYRETLRLTQSIVTAAARAKAETREWSKGRLVQTLRNTLPNAAIDWFDATVVLGLDVANPSFPPLMGTGGNDGSLDYSTNFHQRLADVLPELGAVPKVSRGWAHDLMSGEFTTKLVSAAVGQGDSLGAGGPNSSVFGSADSRVNPWAFILMLEGALWFAASASRRLNGSGGKTSIPFTVQFSPESPTPTAAAEDSRGELWAPVFASVTAPHLRQIMSEARASWQGSMARKSVDMYGAVQTYGVDRGIERFERFAFLQRNGLAYVAVHLDSVFVVARPEVALARMPLRRGEAYARGSGAATAIAARRFDRDISAFVREPSPESLLEALASQTNLEQQAWRSKRNREEISLRALGADAAEVFGYLNTEHFFLDNAEARVAAGLASGWRSEAGQYRGMRALLLGADPARSLPDGEAPVAAVAAGLGSRPLADVLADVIVWCPQHPQENLRFARGFQPFNGHSYRTHWTDLHAWAAGLLDESLIQTYFMAFVSLSWSSRIPRQITGKSPVTAIDPTLGILQALASGWVIGTGVAANADDGRTGLAFDWPIRLRAGRIDEVLAEAAALLGRSRVVSRSSNGGDGQPRYVSTHYTFEPQGLHTSTPEHGSRILAALAGPASTGALRAIASRYDEDVLTLTVPEGDLA